MALPNAAPLVTLPPLYIPKDCVYLQGLPHEVQVGTILQFLGEHAFGVLHHGVHLIYDAYGQPSGEAFIQMYSEDSAFWAALHCNHYMIGKRPRYIEAFQCSMNDVLARASAAIPVLFPFIVSAPLAAPYVAYLPALLPVLLLPPVALTALPSCHMPGCNLPGHATVHVVTAFSYGFLVFATYCFPAPRLPGDRTDYGAFGASPSYAEDVPAVQEWHRRNIGNR